MWICQKCGEQHQDSFESCWKCAPQNSPQETSKAEEPDASQGILKITSRLAALVSIIWLLVSFHLSGALRNRGGGGGIFNEGVVATVEFVSIAIYIAINLALPFALSFTPFLGVALLFKLRLLKQDYRKAVLILNVSLIPFLISLYCFWGFVLPAILHRLHKQ